MPYLTRGVELGLSGAPEAMDQALVVKGSTMSCDEAKREKKGSDSKTCGTKDGVTYLQLLPNGHAKPEWPDTEVMDGVESTSPKTSPPPTPVVEESAIFKPSRLPCPARLRPLVPPLNYGAVKENEIFRSAYPEDYNLEFLQRIGVKTILTLVETPPSDEYITFIRDHGIVQKKVHVRANKDGDINVTTESIAQALLIMLDSSFYPLYVHCNRGKHRTGCVVACLRRIQKWPIENILTEYVAYASPKARPDDIVFIKSFNPACVFEYAKAHGYLSQPGILRRIDSDVSNIDALAEALASGPHGSYTDVAVFDSGSSSTSSNGSLATVPDDFVTDDTLVDPSLQLAAQPASTGDATTKFGSVSTSDWLPATRGLFTTGAVSTDIMTGICTTSSLSTMAMTETPTTKGTITDFAVVDAETQASFQRETSSLSISTDGSSDSNTTAGGDEDLL